jgi:hypothetical protein
MNTPFRPRLTPVARRVAVHALLIPVDPGTRCAVLELALTAAALSDAIGGGLLDEALVESLDGVSYCVYADLDRVTRQLPPNARVAVLAARLGWIDLVDRAHLRGDLLIVGADDQGNDTDVPISVIEAAQRCGLLPCVASDPGTAPGP